MGNTVDKMMVDSATKVWHVRGGEAVAAADEGVAARMKSFVSKMGLPSDAHVIHLNHHESGERKLYVDGQLVHVGQSTFASAQLSFSINSALSKCVVSIIFNTSWTDHSWSYRYVCSVNGQQVKEINEVPANEDIHTRINVCVDSYRSEGAGSKAYAVYDVVAEIKGGDEEGKYLTTHRYREFNNLSKVVKSSFINSHMYSSIPKMPGKQIKALSNHMSDAFLLKRRQQLNTFVQKLIKLPRVMQLPPVRIFLGIVEEPSLLSDVIEVAYTRPTGTPKEQLSAALRGETSVAASKKSKATSGSSNSKQQPARAAPASSAGARAQRISASEEGQFI